MSTRVVPALAALTLVLGPPARTAACATIVVTKAAVAYPHRTTIQAAVDAARPCDWILVAPGAYRESVTIRTPGLHLRGLDRNRVLLDGGHRAGNGIVVEGDGAWIENLTVRNFDRQSINAEGSGTEILWRRVHGWRGNYLTTYDTGLLGGYGLFARSSPGGEWRHVYASGFNDSGLYVGSCRDCRTIVSDALAERNALGLAASNASGHLVVEDSLFRDNAIGLSLNSTESDPPPPQLGTCAAASNRSPTPTLASTAIARCTIVRHNRLVANDNLTVPSDTSSARPGWGIGILFLGTYGDLVSANLLERNRNLGILALEFPYAPTPPGAARFQLSGNRFERNIVRGSATDIALEGGLFGARRSVDNCFADERFRHSLPADLTPFDCARAKTPNPDLRTNRRVLRLVLELHREFVARRPRGQPAPPPQPTMPDPCRGAPPSPLCPCAA